MILKNESESCFHQLLLPFVDWERNAEIQSITGGENLSEECNDSGETLLHLASRCKNAPIALYLIELGFDINAQNKLGQTPIMVALEKENNEKNIEILCKANADIYMCDKNGKSALKRVVDFSIPRSVKIIELFIKKVHSDCENNNQLTAQRLLDVTCPLEYVMYLKKSEVTKIMIHNGSSVHTRHPKLGTTALHIAVKLMDEKNVELLIKCGANVNAKDEYGYRPLRYFCENFHYPIQQQPNIIKILFKKGAFIAKCGQKGKLPIYNILRYGTKETIQTLLQCNIDFNSKNFTPMTGGTLLHVLVQNKNSYVTSGLKVKNVDVNARDQIGRTPMFNAVLSRNKSTLQFLLDNNSNVNAKDVIDKTPLFYACLNNNFKETLEFLLQKGARIQVITKDKETVFDVILENDSFDLAKPLLAHLAIDEEQGQTITEFIQRAIDSHEMFKNHFQLCKRRIQQMKSTVFYGKITLYDLLIESEENLAKRCVCNNVLLNKIAKMNGKRRSNFYYYGVLRKRSIGIVDRIENSAFVLDKIIGLRCDIILRKVVDFLSYDDLLNLNKVLQR